MDLVTEKIIEVCKELNNIEITEDDIMSGRPFSDFNVDSLSLIEMLMEIEESIPGLYLPTIDNSDLTDLKQLWTFITKNLPNE